MTVETNGAVVPIDAARDQKRSAALLKAIGLDRVPPEQREIALAIAKRYDLDLLLKHLVLIEGKPYITRDGLLWVAHRHGALDGIEVTDPEVVELAGLGAFWRATCSVYRKDMSRPFTYAGRYPVKGKNVAFGPEMAVKVAEVMALRRAFNVSAPTLEERWDVDASAVIAIEPEQPLAERVAEKAAAITSGPRAERQEPRLPSQAPAAGQEEEHAGAAGAVAVSGVAPLPVEPAVARKDTSAHDSEPSSAEAGSVNSAPTPAPDTAERCVGFHAAHGRCELDAGHEGPHQGRKDAEQWT